MNTTKKKLFGTDGIRGKVGVHPITPQFMLSLGWALGTVISEQMQMSDCRAKVLIGKDTRISGYMFESALEAGLVAAGVDIQLLGPMPTPAIAYLTRTLRAQAGMVISASHNPYHDNGIKLFSSEGVKLPDAMELAIEDRLKNTIQCVSSDRLGRASRVPDAAGRYIEFCKSVLHGRTTLSSQRIVVDCAQGATYHIAPKVLSELGAQVITLHNTPDGLNINKNCGSTQPQRLIEAVLTEQADIGIGLDGDGDRVILVDHRGQIVDGDSILYILGKYYLADKTVKTGIVGTQMSNLGLELALQSLSIPFKRVQVGDRHVLEALQSSHWLLGGEPSGHIICLDKNTSGDGIIAALHVLKIMQERQASLSALLADFHKYPQQIINVKSTGLENPCGHPTIRREIDKIQKQLGQSGRVLLRRSGTEPLIRVMVEGEDEKRVKQVAQTLAALVSEVQSEPHT